MSKQSALMQVRYRYRLYPTSDQIAFLLKTLGCARKVYNLALAESEKSYNSSRKRMNLKELSRYVTVLRHDENYKYLAEAPSVVLQQSIRSLDKAQSSFFSKVKKKIPTGKFRFKSQRENTQAFNLTKNTFKVSVQGIAIPKLKENIEIRWSRALPSKPSSATIIKDAADRFFVSFVCEVSSAALTDNEIKELAVNNADEFVGIDVGYIDYEYLSLSDGRKYSISKSRLQRKKWKVERCQRALSKKKKFDVKKGENEPSNRRKSRIRLAKAWTELTDYRTDFLQKRATALIRENQGIIVEKLKIDSMIERKNQTPKKTRRSKNRSLSTSSWSRFFDMLHYGAKRRGKVFYQADPAYTSQKCSQCGFLNEQMKNLKNRTLICSNCNFSIDRDHNAARNILAAGLAVLAC